MNIDTRIKFRHLLCFLEIARQRIKHLHLGVYAYRPEALRRYMALGVSQLEELEGLEQLRFLAGGVPVGVVPFEPIAVAVAFRDLALVARLGTVTSVLASRRCFHTGRTWYPSPNAFSEPTFMPMSNHGSSGP